MDEQPRRRRVPRQQAGWFAKCKLESDRGAAWSDCRVIDVSTVGAGVEVRGLSTTRSLVGARLAVEVQAPHAGTFSLRFVGEIKNATTVPHEGLRLGMEFADLSETERAILDLFNKMDVAW